MYRMARRGLGDFSISATGPSCTSSLSWIDPACWGLWALGNATGQVNDAGNFDTSSSYPVGYTPPPAPLPPPAPTGDALTLPPASGADAQSTVNDLIAQNVAQNQQQMQNFYNNLKPPATCAMTLAPSAGICDSTIYWGVGIAAVFVGMVFMLGGRR